MTVLAAGRVGGAALLGGLYDRKTLSELTAEIPMRRLLYMTDTIQRTAAALPRSIRQRTDAELCLLRLCDESLSNDTEALADRVSALEDALKKGVVPAERPAARPAAAPTPPPRREVSPIPQETSPAPVPTPAPAAPAPATPAPESAPAAPGTGGDSQVWAALIEHYKGPLTIPDRVWLNQATGTLEGDVLTVSCANDLVKQQLSRKAIEDVLCGVTSRHVGDDPELHAKALRLDPTGARILFAQVEALPMASSNLRARLAAGEACENELPALVRRVIRREGLYRADRGESGNHESETGKGACARPLER